MSNHKERTHNLQFSDVAKMLSGNVLIEPVKVKPGEDSNKFYAISYWNSGYYYTIFTLQGRTDVPGTLFAIVLTTYITYEHRIINKYKDYIEEINTRYGH